MESEAGGPEFQVNLVCRGNFKTARITPRFVILNKTKKTNKRPVGTLEIFHINNKKMRSDINQDQKNDSVGKYATTKTW